MISKAIQSILKASTDISTIVVGDLPASPVDVVSIVDYDGNSSTEYFGSNSSSIFKPIVKVVVRNSNYVIGSTQAESIKEVLHRYHDDYFLSILISGDIQYLGRSPEKNHEFQLIFITQTKE